MTRKSIEDSSVADEAMGFVSPGVTNTPEGRLALAILQRAVLDLVSPGVPRHFTQTAKWWLEGDGEAHIFSFESIAELLCDDPDALKARILRFVARARRNANALRHGIHSHNPRGVYYVKRGCPRVIRRERG